MGDREDEIKCLLEKLSGAESVSNLEADVNKLLDILTEEEVEDLFRQVRFLSFLQVIRENRQNPPEDPDREKARELQPGESHPTDPD